MIMTSPQVLPNRGPNMADGCRKECEQSKPILAFPISSTSLPPSAPVPIPVNGSSTIPESASSVTSPSNIASVTAHPPIPISPRPGLSFDATDLKLCSGVTPPALLPLKPEHLENVLTNGTRMLKYPSKASSRPAERLIRVDLSSLQIFWESKKKQKDLSSVDLHAIREIRLGQNTKAFELQGKRPEYEDRAFSVIYVASGDYKMLNLVAPTKEDASLWISGLHMLMAQTDLTEGDPGKLSQNMSTWLRKRWKEADTSSDGKLDLDEVTALMKKLNIKLSKSEVKSTFKNANVDKAGCLNFTSFERLYRVLRFRPEISELFFSLSRTETSLITYEEFRQFVFEVQKNDWTEDRCSDIYNKYTAADGGRMNIDHFTAFLLSANNAIFKKAHSEIFQDMTRPLTDYFINTSHNTYLLKDQLAGESSVEGYIRALQRGCRCVELDCYDGTNGLPVIYHGRTLVAKLLFKDVIDAIAKYAFVATPYPLTLSLESHCGLEQQTAMARILKESLGDFLLQRPVSESAKTLPSPEALKNKIILKGKIIPPGELGDDTDYSSDDETELLESPTQLVESSTNGTSIIGRPPSKRSITGGSNATEETDLIIRRRGSDDEVGVVKKKSSPKLARKYVVAKSLTDLLIYCKGVHFTTFSAALDKYDFNHMCSLSEKKSLGLMQRQRKEYTEHTRRFLTRIYPAGIRVTSTNYDPVPHWRVGAQMVALNYQTFDRGMQLNHAMFNLNGRSGYVLKPPSLLKGGTPSRQPIMVLTVEIVSGQQLPKPKDSSVGTIIDPYIEVEIVGSEPDNARFRTRAVSNNGFNPVWKEKFLFMITDMDLAFLRFAIYDLDVRISNDFVGSYAIPVQSIEQGYRHVPVYSWKGDFVRFSSIFVRLSLQPLKSESSPQTSPSLMRAAEAEMAVGGIPGDAHEKRRTISGSDRFYASPAGSVEMLKSSRSNSNRGASGAEAAPPSNDPVISPPPSKGRTLSFGSLGMMPLGLR
ncbi:PLC-like phosphodiesterase [Phlyctochytrium arcticum]|nr:PLC-like phosphodiesterase [Phlyctochytrium arcticum]